MNTILWIIQCLLAALFLMAGFGKISGSRQRHTNDGHIRPGASLVPMRVLGGLELLGCVGITMPWLTHIAPLLTPVAALCFCLIMVAGLVVHLQKKEYKMLPLLLVVLGMAAVVAWYRFGALACCRIVVSG